MTRLLPLFLLLIIGFNCKTYSQAFYEKIQNQEIRLSPGFSFLGEVNLTGAAYTGDRLPFWMYHNKRGRVSGDTNISGWITGRSFYKLNNEGFLEAGGGLLYQDGNPDEVFIDELYLHFQDNWMRATAGRKQQQELYNGLSASNRSILWSLNARPLPGIQVATLRPVFLSGDSGIGFEAAWEEYFMGKDRVVENTRLHHKRFHLVYRTGNELQFRIGLNHYVQWGGTSPEFGPQPDGIDDYFKIITGQGGDDEAQLGDQQNALGNHIGGYEFGISKKFTSFSLEAFYQHLLEDGSGRRLGNTPDGRYGIYYENNEKESLVNAVIYELYYTHHQSHTTSGIHKYDHYFNNGMYVSGWTYENRVLGAPFFYVDPNAKGIINNKFLAHHIGLGGQFSSLTQTYPYKFLLSFTRNDGTYARRFQPSQDVLSLFYAMRVFDGFADLDLQLGAEFNSQIRPTYGFGLQLKKQL